MKIISFRKKYFTPYLYFTLLHKQITSTVEHLSSFIDYFLENKQFSNSKSIERKGCSLIYRHLLNKQVLRKRKQQTWHLFWTLFLKNGLENLSRF